MKKYFFLPDGIKICEVSGSTLFYSVIVIAEPCSKIKSKIEWWILDSIDNPSIDFYFYKFKKMFKI